MRFNESNISLIEDVSTYSEEKLVEWLAYHMRLLFVVLMLAGFVTNVLSFFAVVLCKDRHQSHMKLIANLAVADGLFDATGLGVAHIVAEHIYKTNKLPDNPALPALLYFTWIAELLSVFAILLVQYVAVTDPLHYHIKVTTRRTNLGIVFIWSFSLLVGGLSNTLVGIIGALVIGKDINGDAINGDSYEVIYIIWVLSLVSFASFLYFTVRIIRQIRLSNSCQQRETQTDELFRSRKAVVTSLWIACTYITGWLPCFLLESLARIPGVHFHKVSFAITRGFFFVLTIINTIADPVIYGINLKQVHDSYLIMLQCLCHKVCKTK